MAVKWYGETEFWAAIGKGQFRVDQMAVKHMLTFHLQSPTHHRPAYLYLHLHVGR